jgi:hypothetical protein
MSIHEADVAAAQRSGFGDEPGVACGLFMMG